MSKLDELIRELCPDGVEYKKLGEIATVLRGASPRPIKKYITNDSDGVNWIKIGDVPVGSKYITQSEEKITKEGAEKSRYVQKGDFILSNSMSFGRPYILAIDGCIHDGWLSISNFKDVFLSDYLYYLLSSSAIQQEMKKRASFGGAVQNLNADIACSSVSNVYSCIFAPYKEKPRWPMQRGGAAFITLRVTAADGSDVEYISNDIPLEKRCTLHFRALTGVRRPYSVIWQVVNTGQEATMANCLRGNFEPSNEGFDGKRESTLYKGTHSVQCFIIKNGICVAKSKEFIVNIR